MKPSVKKAAFTALTALAVIITAAILQSCPRNSKGETKGIAFFNKANTQQNKPTPQLMYVSGGKLVLYSPDGEPIPISREGQALIPVTSFDVSFAKGEVALACGGKVGVVPVQPKAAPKPEEEEWYDLRVLAGSDAFVSLARLSPDAAIIYAVIYHAGSVEDGYRLLTVTRQTQRIADVPIPKELQNSEPRDIKFDISQTPYILFYDETAPASLIYRFSGGKAERIFSTDDALNKLDLEEETSVPESLRGIYAIDLADYFVQESELLLPVFLLVEGQPAQVGQDSPGLIERTELWHVDLATKQVVKRDALEHDAGKTQSDFSFAMGQDGLYFARLSFADAPEPPAKDESAKPKEGASADGTDAKGGKPAAPAANDEPQQAADAPPTGFALMKLDIASGKTSELMSAPLGGGFYGMSIFPEAVVCAVLEGTEDKLTLSAYSFAGEKLQSGIGVDAPVIQYLPVS